MPFRVPARAGITRFGLKLLLSLLAALAAGCAQSPRQGGSVTSAIPAAQTPYQQALANYRDNRFEPALANLNSAVSNGDLAPDEIINARKHIAFIHCVRKREAQCREQFQAILKIDSDFELAPNESGHPDWGPVWQSVKGAHEEQRAIARGHGILANTAQRKFAEGFEAYGAGRYRDATDAFRLALKSGLLDRDGRILAHKYAAFTYCLTNHQMQCRVEFRAVFSLDPAFELLPSEAGHPAWTTVYREELAAARYLRSESLAKD